MWDGFLVSESETRGEKNPSHMENYTKCSVYIQKPVATKQISWWRVHFIIIMYNYIMSQFSVIILPHRMYFQSDTFSNGTGIYCEVHVVIE